MVAVMIDLSPYRAPFTAFLAGGIREFAEEHPDVEVSCVAFCGFPQIWEGLVSFDGSVCFDTESHSAGNVAKYQDHGPAWFAEDEFGRYDNSPLDFAFAEYRHFSIEGLPSPGEIEIFQSVTGQRYPLDYGKDGDAGLCSVVWHGLFRELMKDFQDFGRLKRAQSLEWVAEFSRVTSETFGDAEKAIQMRG